MAKVGTSNPDRTISLTRLQCEVVQMIIIIIIIIIIITWSPVCEKLDLTSRYKNVAASKTS